jgi:predicted P-loop ATPase
MMEDDLGFFDANPSSQEPPPPKGEGDYGEKVISFKPKNRKQLGWKSEWQIAETGTPLPNLYNVMVTLRNHPELSAVVRYDEMAHTALLVAQIPNTPFDPSIPRQIRDADVIAIQEEIQLTGLRRVPKATVQDGIDLRASQQRFHPVLDYLNGLVWDGETRVGGWLGRYLGVEGGPYADNIGKLFMIALIARQFKPGCKADYMLILEGPQGAMKSSACRVLAGEWFSDNLPDLSRGDAVRLSMHLRGKWLIEIAEMSSFNSAEAHTLKEFLTQTEERYTPKYGRHEVNEPRQCLFIGSTNEGSYLRDATGARRFWPVKVGDIKIDDLKADRDQLLAEAVVLYRSGAQWWPDKDFEATHIAPEQASRYEEDPWETVVISWLEGGPQFDSRGEPVSNFNGNHVVLAPVERCTVNDVLKGPCGLLVGQFGTREQRRVSAIFSRLGWFPKRSDGKRYYERPKQGLAV